MSENLEQQLKSLLNEAEKVETNNQRRVVYSKLELLRLDVEDLVHASQLDAGDAEKILNQVDAATATLSLRCDKRSKGILNFIDEVTRLLAAIISLVYMGWMCVLCVLVQPSDELLVMAGVIQYHQRFNVWMRRMTGFLVVVTSGIELKVYGDVDCSIKNLVCFSHSSTLDAFTGSLAVPAPSLAVSKTDLFLIPFFAWMMAAWGSIPVNRSNRNSAVESLRIASQLAGPGDCVMIAPEGTRSTTGQLLPFKKGPFYLWEAMGKVPMVPLVIYGAYELYPPGSIFNRPGKVYCYFLPPLQFDSGENNDAGREEASRILRRRMLTHMAEHCPVDAGEEISWGQRIKTLIAVICAHSFNVFVILQLYNRYVALPPNQMEKLDGLELIGQLALRWGKLIGFVSLLVVVITLIMFVYSTYVKGWITRLVRGKTQVANRENNTKKKQ